MAELIEYRSPAHLSVLDAARSCVDSSGFTNVTMDDICEAAIASRATVYRLFPGGRDVLLEALRERSLEEFFTLLRAHIEDADSLEDLLVRSIVVATSELQHDEHLAALMATAPGEALGDLTVSGVPRIIRIATAFITPLAQRFITAQEAAEMVDIMSRLVISYFLAPSQTIDFSNEDSTRRFVQAYFNTSTHSIL